MTDGDLSLEERVQVLETLLSAAIWGPYLDEPKHLARIAENLYMRLEAAERHRSFPPAVLAALYRHADALAAIDNIPDALRPAIRPLVQPPDEEAG